ncbi:hypothetical protein, partial [Sutterella wadsworthensis]|uniref:hypothetical protein n=1 Tax=Sutterella wadsworthensis TaxID=40545 RepID=UPI001A9C7BE8
GISSAKHPILDLNHTSSGSVIREFRKQSGNAPSGYVPVLFLMRLRSKSAKKSRPSRLEIDGLVSEKTCPELLVIKFRI